MLADLPYNKAWLIYPIVKNAIVEALQRKETVIIKGFGTFYYGKHRNNITPGDAVRFVPAKELRTAVNNYESPTPSL